MFKSRKNYDSKFKAKPALEAVMGEKTISRLSLDYGVPPNQIGMWKKKLFAGLPIIFDNKSTGDRWRLLGSDAIDFEISRIPDSYRQLKLKIILTIVYNKIKVDKEIVNRTRDVVDIGFKPFDAMHIACAEFAKADVFLIGIYLRHSPVIFIIP